MITALVLAAGLSSRMGRSKPLLPYGEHTVVEHIVSVLRQCPLAEIMVITGFEAGRVTQQLRGLPVRTVFNPGYSSGEMLSSLQVGLRAAAPSATGVLLALGDQPALEPDVVRQVLAAEGEVVFPSYQMRRGHPMLIRRHLWPGILALREGQTLRDFFKNDRVRIQHVNVATPTVLRDMDTPEDYQRELEALKSRSQPNFDLV